MKRSRPLGNKRQSTASLRVSPYGIRVSSLRPSCSSVPIIRALRTRASSRYSGRSTKNEVWDSTTSVPKNAPKATSLRRSKPRSSIKSANSNPTKKKKKRHTVSFAKAPGSIQLYDLISPSTSLWYERTDHRQFLENGIALARIIDRTMKYAKLNENTYNSSTGLTSPQVLKEYLSSPEEIIGMEHMLSNQGFTRLHLMRHHLRVLLEEQCRQRQEKNHDPDLLAKRLMDRSGISTNMAQARASYITLFD